MRVPAVANESGKPKLLHSLTQNALIPCEPTLALFCHLHAGGPIYSTVPLWRTCSKVSSLAEPPFPTQNTSSILFVLPIHRRHCSRHPSIDLETLHSDGAHLLLIPAVSHNPSSNSNPSESPERGLQVQSFPAVVW